MTSGTADPTGGAAGDAYVQVDVSDEIQALWLNEAGTWEEYTIPAGGGGAGDITAVTTGGNSGLSGGSNSGAVDLEFDPDNLPTHTTVDGGDLFVFGDVSATGNPPTNITYGNLAGDLADVGIGAGSDGIHLEVSELPAVTVLQGGDEIPIADDSQTNDDTRKVTVANFAGHLADGTTITADSDGVLTATGGGSGTGDITAVNTPNNSGLSGGAASGDVDLALHANNLPNVTSVATGDHLVLVDASDSNATKRITVNNFGPHLAGTGLDSTSTGQLELDINEPALTSAVADADIAVIADASDSFSTKRVTLATLGTHFGTGGGGGGGTTVSANPGTDDANTDAASLTIAGTDYNVADEAVRDLIGYSGRQELHPRTPLPVQELSGDHYAELRALGYSDGTLYGFHSRASGGTVNGTDLLNSRDPQDGGAVALTPETTPETLYFFLNGSTLYAQNFDGSGSETTFTTTTIRAGTPYALANDPDENGKLYMLIDSGNDVYVEELNYNAGGTITHAETVATITPAILNTFESFGGYEDRTDTAADTGAQGGDASGITDIYVAGDFAWFLVTYARDDVAARDFNYIARFARTDSAITAPATVTDADLIQLGVGSNVNQNSLVALATDAGVISDVFISRATAQFVDHLTNSRLGDYDDLANRPPELSTANVEDAVSETFGLVSGERLEEHTLDAVPDVPIYFDGNMHGDPFDPDNPLGPNVVEFESDSHLNIQYHTDASTTDSTTQEIKGDIYSSGDRTFHISSVDVSSGYVLNRTYHVYLAFVDTANGDQVEAVYPSSTRYLAPSNGRSGVFTHQYTWGSVGIEIPPNTNFYLGLAPTNNQGSTVIRSGAQAGDSPTESNADNSDDITYVSPATRTGFALHVNNTLTRPSNGFVLGNWKIYYHTTLGGIISQAEIEIRNAGVVVDVDNANEAVDGFNVTGGLEAVRDDANPNIPIVRIENLGVSTDKLAGDAVTGDKVADAAIAGEHVEADLSARICPDPSTGSSGQACTRNTAGTAYELTTPSGGGTTTFSTANPADVDDTADPGAGTTVPHANHVHRLQTDASLAFDASGVLGTTGGGGGGGGGGYGDWEDIGSITGSISGNPVAITLDSGEDIDDYEELYIHIEANDTNDQRVASSRFRASEVPVTTLAGGGLGIPFAGNNTDEGAVLVRRNTDGTELTLDVYGSVINFPATSVTTINARTLTAGGGGGGTDDQTAAEVTVDTTNFSRNLTASDDSVQDALETIDGFTQYQGAWQQASWPAGVIVTRSGVAYISLVNSNTEIPTPFSENWSAMVEGLAYRGEAPVLATSYSYGQVVLNPDNDNYYFYTSTISDSVARADIATHANFHGIVIQATEANKGGVRGATAAQAIATSGTTILGWSNNRVRQLVSSALPAMTQADIDNATTGRKSVTGALIASNAGGGTELTQAQVEDETDTTFGSVSGERLAQAVAVFESGGGGGSTDFFDAPIEDVASIDVSNTTPENYLAIDANNVITNRGGFTIEVGTNTHQAIKVPVDGNYTITAVTSILQNNAGVPRNRTRFQFFIVRSGVDVPAAGSGLYASYGRATVPAGFADGSYTVDLLADDQIEMRYSDELATTATYSLGGGLSRISVLLNSGGGSTGGQQAAAGRTLVQRNIITARQAQSEFSISTEWTNVDGTAPTFTAIPKADFDRIEIGFWVNSSFVYPIVLTRAMVTAMGPTNNPLPTGLVDADDIPGAFLTFRTATGPDAREPILLNPRYGFMEARRMASRCGIFIHMNDNSDNDWAQVGFHYVCEDQIDLEYVRAYFYEDN